MLNIVSFCLMAVVVALAVWFLVALLELIVRAALAGAMAFACALAVAIVASHDIVSGLGIGLVAFGLAIIPSFYVVSRMRTAPSIRQMTKSEASLSFSKDIQARGHRASSTTKREEPRTTFADRVLRKAWDEAMQLAPCAELATARENCAQFMSASARAKALDVEVIDYTVFIRHQVPGVVRETVELVAVVNGADRERAISNLVDDLIAVGDGARLQLERIAKPMRDRLAARRSRMGVATGAANDILHLEG